MGYLVTDLVPCTSSNEERGTEHAEGNHLLPGIRWRGRWSGRREHNHFFGAGPRTFLIPHLFLKQKKKKKS